jgi:hypothetical protein
MTEDDTQEASIEIELRSPETVARRCVILASIIQRFSIDATPQDDPYEVAFDLREWLRSERLWDEATPGEQAFFKRPPGRPEPEDDPDVALVAESLATIAWGLALLPSLAYNRLTRLASLIQEIPGPWESTSSWISKQTLRAEAEIARMRETHEVWHWRFEIEVDRRSSTGHELIEIENLIRTVTQEAVAADLLARGKEGGFTIDGVAVTALAASDIAEHQLLTQERLIALNWICGFGDDWDNVPIDI